MNAGFYSDIYPELYTLLNKRAGNNNPKELGGVSGLVPYIRILSGVGDGLIIKSIYKNDNFNLRYGSETSPGILGFDFDNQPIRVRDGRGLRPSPVVESLSIDEKKNGYRQTKFSIKAFTQEQVDKLSSYLLEPGFHILVEWGWNTSEGVSQIVGNGGSVTPCDIALYDRWRTIKEKRQDSNFHYDAVLGVTTGGGVSFGDDETYILNIETTGIGQIAEYMQVHRTSPDKKSTDSQSGQIFSPENIENTEHLGKRLFKIMVNSLPTDKQTSSIQAMLNEGGNKWVDTANFINMDNEVVDHFYSELSKKGTLFSRDTEEVKIPVDVPLLDKDRFIRLELAFEILNRYPLDLSAAESGGCNKKAHKKRISIENTAIRAHPHMFSTDKSKLFIPNTKAPSFNFLKSLTQIEDLDEAKKFIDFENLDAEGNTQNLHPSIEGGGYTDFTLAELRNGARTRYAFPATYRLTEEFKPAHLIDETFIPPTCDKEYWGWLKDLYINFDFFCDVLSKPNLFTRDVVYELLNGLSDACNSLWNFQIVEAPSDLPDDDTDRILTVIDANFSGEVDFNDDRIREFQARGVNSPFNSIDFNVNISGDMLSSIIQERANSSVDGNVEGEDPNYFRASVFTNDKVDEVGKILQNYEKKSEITTSGEDTTLEDTTPEDTTPVPPAEKRSQLYQIFTQRAGVFLKIQDRVGIDNIDITDGGWFDWFEGDPKSIEDVLFVGTWDDKLALKKVYLIDMGHHGNIKVATRDKETSLRNNVPLGLADVSFTVLGVSGFKLFDRLRINGLPRKFSSGIYQIINIEQSVNSTMWETSVTAMFSPAPAEPQLIIEE